MVKPAICCYKVYNNRYTSAELNGQDEKEFLNEKIMLLWAPTVDAQSLKRLKY